MTRHRQQMRCDSDGDGVGSVMGYVMGYVMGSDGEECVEIRKSVEKVLKLCLLSFVRVFFFCIKNCRVGASWRGHRPMDGR